MKRKYNSEESEEFKKSRNEGCFSILTKRKNDFYQPNPKRHHAFSEVEEQKRTIRQLENTVQALLGHIKKLEYQLELQRISNHHGVLRQIESF